MAKRNEKKPDEALENLTEEQQKALAEALVEVKLQVFQHTVRRLKVYLGVLLVVIGGETLLLGRGMRRDIVEATAALLGKDQEMRGKIETAAAEEVRKGAASAAKAEAIAKNLEELQIQAELRIETAVKSAEERDLARLAGLDQTIDELNRMLVVAVSRPAGGEAHAASTARESSPQ